MTRNFEVKYETVKQNITNSVNTRAMNKNNIFFYGNILFNFTHYKNRKY